MKLLGHVCNAVLRGWLQLSCSESVVHRCVVSFLFLDLDSADRVDCRRESFFLHVPESLNSPIESLSRNVMMRHSHKSILFHYNTSLHVKAVGVCCSDHSFLLVDPMRRKEMGLLCLNCFRKGFRRTLFLRGQPLVGNGRRSQGLTLTHRPGRTNCPIGRLMRHFTHFQERRCSFHKILVGPFR